MTWIQTYTPAAGSLGLSALIAAIPLVVIFICLAVLKMKAHKAGPLAVAHWQTAKVRPQVMIAGSTSMVFFQPTMIMIT